MATITNGHVNGVNGHSTESGFSRFSQVPQVIDIPVQQDENEAVQIDLTQLEDDIEELCALLETENAARNYWITIALAYVKINKADLAIDLLKKALEAQERGRSEDRLSILMCLCWLYLWRCRRAPRVKPTQGTEDDRVKEYWLTQATSTLNEGSKINPSYSPLFLARGSIGLLRASLLQRVERDEQLRQASKNFDEAYRSSGFKNLMAVLGKAKVQFSAGKYADAYVLYQQVLERAPDMIDPDPRIGIGCCLWQLGHKENAKEAWERSLTLNSKSKIANILLGLYFLNDSSRYNSGDPEFADIYRKAMTTYTQTAFKLDDMHALTCSTFGGYFLLRKTWANVERLARRAIEHTDVNAIASDGWYLLARKDHYEGDLAKAQDHYGKADQARGGDEKGYVPAKFGVAQLRVLMQDYDGAKFRLEKMMTTHKSVEMMTLLGILNAEDVFAAQASGSKEDKSNERKKAIGLLEQVRVAWKDAKRKIQPDSAVLLNLARLYESDQPDKALQCLQQVEQMEAEEISDDDVELPRELDLENEADVKAATAAAKQQMLSPQLLNNIGCFHFQFGKLPEAREYFYAALQSSAKIAATDKSIDTDALVSSISYNYARTWEAEGVQDRAKEVYDSLLERHPDYIDAKTRLAFMTIQDDKKQGMEEVKRLMDADPTNLEVRSLFGYCLHHNKKRTLQLSEDQEQRHFKHTLMTYDKHDLYALTAMGNLNLAVAREMPRDTDQHKDRRTKTYMRAVEFYDKVLSLDPRNAYAAQGMGIAMVEDKKDTSAAIQIFSKVRESLKDASVQINLGHVFCDMKQYSRSIDAYANASKQLREQDPAILACLGRAWLMRGRAEKMINHYKQSLDYARKALEIAPEKDLTAFKFNVAFVQIQIAQQMISQPEANKTTKDMETAMEDLDSAIESFIAIARSPNPPFPKNDIEQRANMGRNTMKRQLAASFEKQVEWENKNKTRLEEARRHQEEANRRREEEKRIALEKVEEEKRKVRLERERMQEEDRQLIARRLEEDRIREQAEYTTDAETGERKKREKKPKEKRQKRKKKGDETDTDVDGLGDGTGDEGGRRSKPHSRLASQTASDGEAPRRKTKKRRLERKGTATKSSKFKSAERIEDSDDEDDEAGLQPAAKSDDVETPGAESTPAPVDDDMADGGDEEEEEAAAPRPARKKQARIVDDDDEDEEEAPATNGGDTSMADDEVVAAGESDHGGG